MKNIQNKLIVLLFLVSVFPNLGSSQDNLTNELSFEVNRIYPHILITKEKLKEANSVADLNRHYKPSWISEFISVEILTTHNGKTMKAVSKNDVLTQEQKDRMNKADIGTDISVKIAYIPENTLKHNDAKEFEFTFIVDAENEAKYTGGEQELTKYLTEKAINNIPSDRFKGYDLVAIKFTINEEGEVVNAHVFGSGYNNEKIDKLLLKTIQNMPCWKPAEYVDGTKVQQEFVLTVGNMENCVINTFNIQRDGRPRNG